MSNIGEFHHAEDAPDKKSRTMVAVVIVLAIVGFGVYVYESGMWDPKPRAEATQKLLP